MHPPRFPAQPRACFLPACPGNGMRPANPARDVAVCGAVCAAGERFVSRSGTVGAISYAFQAEGLIKSSGKTTALAGTGLTAGSGTLLGLLGRTGTGRPPLRSGDPVTRRLVAEAIDRLLDDGPALGRPLADRISGSRLHNLKELRPGPSGTPEVRILFIFDPARNAVLLVAGDKSGRWEQWYRDAIPAAEAAY